MKGNEFWKIVLGILASVGGIGGIIIFVVKISVNIIADKLKEKYQFKLTKELEKYKSNIDNKIYISKTKFDTEFNIYRELSKVFFKMIKYISSMIPAGFSQAIADGKAQEKYENKLYSRALRTTIIAQDVLNSNAPFIPNNIFEKYNYILILCRQQLRAFERRWNVGYIGTQEGKKSFSTEDYERTEEINTKFEELNENIREYLSKLDVLD